MSTASTSTTSTEDDEYDVLPHPRPMHTTDAFARLDTPLRQAITNIAEHGWQPTDAWRRPHDLAASLGYCLRARGVSIYAAFALVDVALADVVEINDAEMTAAVWRGTKLAEQHAEQTLDVEIRAASPKRAQHAGALWTARIYMRPVTPTSTTPGETSYACALVDDSGAPTAELRALVDAVRSDVLDLDRELDRVFLLRDRLVGRRARAITRNGQSITTHLLRLDGYR